MLKHWIWLSTRKAMTEREIAAVYRYFGDPESAYNGDEQTYRRIPGINARAVGSLCDKSLEGVGRLLEQCRQKQIHVLSIQDAAYPQRLRGIIDPPMVLYYKGMLPDFEEMPIIGAVGTRSCSEYGMEMARKLGYQLSQGGAAVVSGMADGIDTGAIGGALAAGGKVIGILGCGVDRVYPASNARLYEHVMKQGCLISEFPPETQPLKWNFPKRNRLISGISNGVLVIEAPERSGALITARQALEQGRDLFAVPGNANLSSAGGSNRLLQDGAVMVQCGKDVLEYYQARYAALSVQDGECPEPSELKKMAEAFGNFQGKTPIKTEKIRREDKKVIDNPSNPPYIDVEKNAPALSEQERAIVSQLGNGPMHTDDVVYGSGLPMGKAMSVLTMLEIRGIIRRLPGNTIALREQ